MEIENDINWAWFVNRLKMDLELGDGSNFTIISDRKKVRIYVLFRRVCCFTYFKTVLYQNNKCFMCCFVGFVESCSSRAP